MKLVDDEFTDAMHQEFYKGANKDGRAYFDWKRLKWDSDKELLYIAKLLGHVAIGIRAGDYQTRRRHLAAVACNANILWYHVKEDDYENDT